MPLALSRGEEDGVRCAVVEAFIDVEAEDVMDVDGTKEITVVSAPVAVEPVGLVNMDGLEAVWPLDLVLPDPVCEGTLASELV